MKICKSRLEFMIFYVEKWKTWENRRQKIHHVFSDLEFVIFSICQKKKIMKQIS